MTKIKESNLKNTPKMETGKNFRCIKCTTWEICICDAFDKKTKIYACGIYN